MSLDSLRRPANGTRFDHVGIQRSLHQPLNLAFFLLDAMSLLIENRDEFVADDLPLLLRIGHTFELAEKALRRIHRDQMQPRIVTQRPLNFLKLVLSQHAVVDKNTG